MLIFFSLIFICLLKYDPFQELLSLFLKLQFQLQLLTSFFIN